MVIKTNSASWTGLASDEGQYNIRAAQTPREGGPLELPEMTYSVRTFDWLRAVFFTVFFSVFTLSVQDDWPRIAMTIALYFALVSAVVLLISAMRRAFHHSQSVKLSAAGLELTRDYDRPIPWSAVGEISLAKPAILGWITIKIKPDLGLQALPPWPIRSLMGSLTETPLPAVMISCWKTKADAELLAAQLEEYRDNYCSA